MGDNYTKGFEDIEPKVVAILEKFLHDVLLKIIRDADELIRNNKPYPMIATGETIKNLREEVINEAGKLIGVAGVGANVPYAIYAHEGTRPHWPPQFAIQQWIIQRGLLKDIKNKRVTASRLMRDKKNYDEFHAQLKSFAFLIARKISKKGIPGLAFLRLALNQNMDYIAKKLTGLKI